MESVQFNYTLHPILPFWGGKTATFGCTRSHDTVCLCRCNCVWFTPPLCILSDFRGSAVSRMVVGTYMRIPAGIQAYMFEEDEVTCAMDTDPVWGIVWSQTAAGGTDTKRCPGGISSAKGVCVRTYMCTVRTYVSTYVCAVGLTGRV